MSRIILFRKLEEALDSFRPDFVVYNAGTDILEGDPLGALAISDNVCSCLYVAHNSHLISAEL